MDEYLSAQYNLNCRRILEFLRTELGLSACVIYHKNDQCGVAELIVGALPGVLEGESHASLNTITQLVHSGRVNYIVSDVNQSLYAKEKVFYEDAPVAIVACPLTNPDDSQRSVICGISFDCAQKDLTNKLPVLQFCSTQIDSGRSSLLKNIDDSHTIESLTSQAFHDSMTGLLNRNGFEAAIATSVAEGFGGNICISVFVVDVDGLKLLNDTQGHAAGDEVIKQVATVLKSYFEPRPIDVEAQNESFVARTGGDEYIGLLYDCDDEVAQVIKLKIAEELIELGISVSIGLASCRSARRLSDAIINADEAMYIEKSRLDSCRGGTTTTLKLAG